MERRFAAAGGAWVEVVRAADAVTLALGPVGVHPVFSKAPASGNPAARRRFVSRRGTRTDPWVRRPTKLRGPDVRL
jgi:hypothetical protein